MCLQFKFQITLIICKKTSKTHKTGDLAPNFKSQLKSFKFLLQIIYLNIKVDFSQSLKKLQAYPNDFSMYHFRKISTISIMGV